MLSFLIGHGTGKQNAVCPKKPASPDSLEDEAEAPENQMGHKNYLYKHDEEVCEYAKAMKTMLCCVLSYFDLPREFFEFLLSLNFSKETLLFKKTIPNIEVCPKSLRAMLEYCENSIVISDSQEFCYRS